MCVKWVPSENVSNRYPSPTPATNMMGIEIDGTVYEVTGQEQEEILLVAAFFAKMEAWTTPEEEPSNEDYQVEARHVQRAFRTLADM